MHQRREQKTTQSPPKTRAGNVNISKSLFMHSGREPKTTLSPTKRRAGRSRLASYSLCISTGTIYFTFRGNGRSGTDGHESTLTEFEGQKPTRRL